MIRVQCPHCKRRYRTEMEAFGRTAVCTKCLQTFKIGESRPPFQWKNTDLAEDSWIGVPEPEEKQEMKHCIICDAPLLPDTIRCPECGTNQVTGMVRKSPPVKKVEEPSFWSVIPLRLILGVVALAALGAGAFWGAKFIARQGVELGDEMADVSTAARAAKALEKGEDPQEIALNYSGYVKDSNLARFADMLTGNNEFRRQAAVLLIASGQAVRLGPVVTAARSTDSRTAGAGLAALQGIGPRRLVELSVHEDAEVRRSAAEALVLIFDPEGKQAPAGSLSQRMPLTDKFNVLKSLYRPYPELVGAFAVNIDETRSPFTVYVEQIGNAFCLKINQEEFVTDPGTQEFKIPIDRWCAATGTAVDRRSVRQLIGGSVVITARAGALWEGRVVVIAQRPRAGPLPGFLPIQVPAPGQPVEATLRLDR